MRITTWVGLVAVCCVMVSSATGQASAQGLTLTSPLYQANGLIPAANTCDGTAGNPPLVFSGVPPGAKSLAVVFEDRDIPRIFQSDGVFIHWATWDLPPETTGIAEGKGSGGVNGSGKGYADPCPPDGEHHYVFKLYALDTTLGPGPNITSAADLYRAMEGHTLAQTELIGRYRRPTSKIVVGFVILGVIGLLLLGIVYGVYRGIRATIRHLSHR